MKIKFTPPPRKNRAALLIIFMSMLVFYQCKKTDKVSTLSKPQTTTLSTTEKRFFTEHYPTNPTAQSILNFVKQENEKYHFVNNVVNTVGYPYWDKLLQTGTPTVLGKGSTADTTQYLYLPFVRDSQNYVNATLVFKTTHDTAFKWLCDWQYQQKPPGSILDKTKGDYLAVFFMLLDNKVLNHTSFNIEDENLCTINQHKGIDVLINTDNTTNKTAVQTCTTLTFEYEDCPFIPLGKNCKEGGGCDDCWRCRKSVGYTYCLEDGLDPEQQGGGWIYSSGGGTGGGGGGGNNGGYNPPTCPGGDPFAITNPSSKNQVVYGCSPGWHPSGGGGGTPPNLPPCDAFVIGLQNDAVFASKLKNLGTPNILSLSYETGYFITAGNNYLEMSGSTIDPIITFTFSLQMKGYLHDHYNGLNNIFSCNDLVLMAQTYLKGFVTDSNNLFFAMTSAEGPYLVKVSNTAVYRLFAENITKPIITKKGKQKIFSEENNYKLTSPSTTLNEIALLKIIKDNGGDAGIKLYRGNVDCNHWTELTLGAFNSVTEKNCY